MSRPACGWRAWMAMLTVLACCAPAMAVPETPALMVFTGRIANVPPGQLSAPSSGALVLVFSMADGRLVGSGVVGADSEFHATVTATASFNGTPVVLELQSGAARHALLHDDGSTAWHRFAGRLLPEELRRSLRVGRKTADLTPLELASPQAQRLGLRADLPCDPMADVNEDGVCDEADRRILMLYGGGVTRSVGRR